MINYKALAKRFEERLNANISAYTVDGLTLAELFPFDRFRFVVHTDSGEYIKDYREGNIVTHNVNAVFTCVSSSQDGLAAAQESGVLDVSVQYLLPWAEIAVKDESGNIVTEYNFAEILREVVQKTCQLQMADTTDDEYYIGMQYTMPTAGQRDAIEGVGDCITFDNTIRYIYIANGIGSSEYEVYVKNGNQWERIYYTTCGFSRTSVSEGANSTTDTVSKNIVQTTAFTINMTAPTRITFFEFVKDRYLFDGVIPSMQIKVKHKRSAGSGETTTAETEYKMTFANASISAELAFGASTEYTLVEQFEV